MAQKTAVDKTWLNLKKFLADEYTDYLEDNAAEENNPFRASNAVYDETMQALQTIMENMQNNQANMTTLSEANANLVTRNDSLLDAIKTLQNQVQLLITKVQSLETGGTGGGGGQPRDSRPPSKRKKYCYTCGIQFHHFSNGCPIRPSGHQLKATWKNRMGGSDADHTKNE